jgi:hypothetical protein
MQDRRQVVPEVMVNPKGDATFAALVDDLVRDGIASPSSLQSELRVIYPKAVVRPRGLSGEPPAWYVYRDGRWVGFS